MNTALPLVRSSILLAIAALPCSLTSAVWAEDPAKTVTKTVSVPSHLTLDRALEAIEDVPAIFDRYKPVVPWVPGVTMEITKQVISRGRPAVVALDLDGKAPFAGPIDERALVSATVTDITCSGNLLSANGRMIHLDFKGSTRNVERRVNRIDIQVCASGTAAAPKLTAVGNLYEGYLPIDPDKPEFGEKVAANAIQTAFIKQVDPLVDAVNDLWGDIH
jgi:hypothetical protein